MKLVNGRETPETKDYRVTNDGVMVADIGFKKQLWALDSELDVVWDWGSHRWEIWRFPGQAKVAKKNIFDPRASHVMTVQTKNRDFRSLGSDILLKLQAGDLNKFSVKQLYAYFDKMDENIRRAKEREFLNKINAITTEFADYMRGVKKIQVPRKIRIARAITGD